MPFDLPSLPKSFVFNTSVIAAIALSALIAIVFLWQFLPILLEFPEAQNKTAALDVSFSYPQQVAPGDEWPISGSAVNPSNETVNNILVRLLSDSNVQGTDYNIPFLEPEGMQNFSLNARIRKSAFEGDFTAKVLVSVGSDAPAEYEMPITIKR